MGPTNGTLFGIGSVTKTLFRHENRIVHRRRYPHHRLDFGILRVPCRPLDPCLIGVGAYFHPAYVDPPRRLSVRLCSVTLYTPN